MADEKNEAAKPQADKQRKPGEKSKGQYGGLKSLGPGGGEDIAEATDLEPTDDKSDKARRG